MDKVSKLNKLSKLSQKSYKCSKTIFKNEWNNIRDIKVIGDIHGDYDVLIKSLKKAKVIRKKRNKEEYTWIGGKTHVVQLGDILDRGGRPGVSTHVSNPYEEYKIYEFLNNLDIEAQKSNGKVHYLIGNHELMNMMGDFRYVHDDHVINREIRQQLFAPGGYMSTMLACHSYAVLKINNWYFCHAGLLPQHVTNKNINQINNFVRGVLRGQIDQSHSDYMEMIASPNSLFWNRYYVNNADKCTILNQTLDLLGNKSGGGGMVVGHTPHQNIASDCNQRIWFADVGLSDGFGKDYFNNIQILHIENNKPKIIK